MKIDDLVLALLQFYIPGYISLSMFNILTCKNKKNHATSYAISVVLAVVVNFFVSSIQLSILVEIFVGIIFAIIFWKIKTNKVIQKFLVEHINICLDDSVFFSLFSEPTFISIITNDNRELSGRYITHDNNIVISDLYNRGSLIVLKISDIKQITTIPT